MMNINNIDDRKQYENNQLFPALKTIYSGIFGEDIPIICGSQALYLQGINLGDFPKDIDIILKNDYSSLCKIFFIAPLVRKYGLNIDVLPRKYEQYVNEIMIDNTKIYVCDAHRAINYWIPYLIDVYTDRNNIEKVNKHKSHLQYIKENYPEYFDEKNNKYLENFS